MLKKYNTWIGILSYIMLVVLAIVKLNTGNPSDTVFVVTEILLYIIVAVTGIFCIKEANK